MNMIRAIRNSRAVRDFSPELVSVDQIFQVIGAATWAPSAMNAQPWHFTVVAERSALDEIADRAKGWMLANTDSLPRSAHFRDLMADPQFNILYRAPALIAISAPKGPWAREDCALAAQNLMLMASELGLGTCWVGFAQGWLNTREGLCTLNLSADHEVVAPIILGHPRMTTPVVARKKPEINWVRHVTKNADRDEPEPERPSPSGSLIHP